MKNRDKTEKEKELLSALLTPKGELNYKLWDILREEALVARQEKSKLEHLFLTQELKAQKLEKQALKALKKSNLSSWEKEQAIVDFNNELEIKTLEGFNLPF